MKIKSFLKFTLIVMISQIITYYIAGIIAQNLLGANEFYPPSARAIIYLKDPHDPTLQLWILPAQAFRGILFAIVLFPFKQYFTQWGTWVGGIAVASVIFLIGYVAASGGMVEHFVYFKSEYYPAKFAIITFIEILIQTLALGPMVVSLNRRFNPQA